MQVFSGLEHVVCENEPLAPYTWFRLGGPAEYFAEPTSVEELGELVRRCRQNQIPVRLLGGGSNLLVRDAGVRGLVLRLSAPPFCGIKITDQTIVAGGGAKLGHVISTAVREGLGGLEQLVGIPGSVGGAMHGNAGTQGGDIGQHAISARVMTRIGELFERQRDDLRFAYRQSSLDELAILDATFRLERVNPRELTKRMQTLWIIKKANQPKGDQRSGCIFKDPDGAAAASMLEQAGLKGLIRGPAQVSADNANFIVAGPGATSADILDLIDTMRQQVGTRLGVELELDIEIW